MSETATFARTCDTCGKGMDEGYLCPETGQTYCSEQCLKDSLTPEEDFETLLDDEDAFWTTWYDDEDEV